MIVGAFGSLECRAKSDTKKSLVDEDQPVVFSSQWYLKQQQPVTNLKAHILVKNINIVNGSATITTH